MTATWAISDQLPTPTVGYGFKFVTSIKRSSAIRLMISFDWPCRSHPRREALIFRA